MIWKTKVSQFLLALLLISFGGYSFSSDSEGDKPKPVANDNKCGKAFSSKGKNPDVVQLPVSKTKTTKQSQETIVAQETIAAQETVTAGQALAPEEQHFEIVVDLDTTETEPVEWSDEMIEKFKKIANEERNEDNYEVIKQAHETLVYHFSNNDNQFEYLYWAAKFGSEYHESDLLYEVSFTYFNNYLLSEYSLESEPDLLKNAIRYAREAVLQGNNKSKMLLGTMYLYDKQYEKSFRMFKELKDIDYVPSVNEEGKLDYLLAIMYAGGLGTEKNPKLFYDHLLESVMSKYMHSIILLSELYEADLYRDIIFSEMSFFQENFFKIYSVPRESHIIFDISETDDGVTVEEINDSLPEIVDQAFGKLLAEATNGEYSAEEARQRVIDIRSVGITTDFKKSFEWMLEAANLGDLMAQVTVLKKYITGSGVTQDLEKARQWYIKIMESPDFDFSEKEDIALQFHIFFPDDPQLAKIEREAILGVRLDADNDNSDSN